MPTKASPVVIADCSGGQNAAQPPHAIAPNQVVVAQNVEWYRSTMGRKRRGSRLVERDAGSTLPTNKKFSTIAGTPFLSETRYGVVIELSDLTGWQGWGYGGTPTDFSSVSALDTPTTNACVLYFNGKWFAAYKSSVDRLHLLGVGGSSGYRVGLAAPAAPAITETAGAATDLRKYRSVLYYSDASGTPRRSEPGTETGVRTLVAERATAGAPLLGGVPPELYSHWELQVASDDDNYATWWVVGRDAATVDIVDNNASIISLEPAPELGLFEVPHSAKYLGRDSSRLLLAGAYENVVDEKLQARVWFTPVLGDRDQGDDERIVDTTTVSNYVDLDAGDNGGAITGFAPPTLGDVLVFKRTQLWKLVRTGNLTAPYQPRMIDPTYGTFGYRTICPGQDATGNPCVYFAASRGPVRVGLNGCEYLGAAIEDVWATVNQYGNVHTSQHGVYFPDKGQYWLWVSVSGATVPSTLLVFTVASGGWAVYAGAIAASLCSALMPRFIQEDNKGVTATIPSQPRVPYCCPNTNGQIAECDAINPQTGAALDTDLETFTSGSAWADGTPYQAYLTTAPLPAKTLDGYMTVMDVSVEADASSATLTLALVRDHGAETRTFTTSLAAAGTETRVMKRIEGAETANAKAVAVAIGDGSAIASQWNLLRAQLRVQEEAQP